MPTRPDAATELLRLHREGPPLIVPNAWDVASARMVESLGFPCVATTSAGVAEALGFADGGWIGRDEMLRAVERIASAVRVPVTADLEDGYADTARGVAETVRLALDAGVVGFNLEDSRPATDGEKRALRGVAEQAERIRAAAEACVAAGVPDAVINARVDVFAREVGEPARRVDLALQRAAAYASAGARCVFPITARDRDTIRALAAGSVVPVNILAMPGVPPVAELAALGVRRVSLGSGLFRRALRAAREAAAEVRERGTFDALFG